VLAGAGGVAIGWRWADPVVGLLITAAILFVLKDAAREVYRRLMDAVDPVLVDQVEATLRGTPEVRDVGGVRLRWIGHRLHAECRIAVADTATIVQAHAFAHDAEHRLIHTVPRLTAAMVHAEPDGPVTAAHHLHDALAVSGEQVDAAVVALRMLADPTRPGCIGCGSCATASTTSPRSPPPPPVSQHLAKLLLVSRV
jgi:Dimerisation domain of Zinc Transporter